MLLMKDKIDERFTWSKGANLSEMKRLGLPVPDGFTITTAACIEYLRQGKSLSTDVKHN